MKDHNNSKKRLRLPASNIKKIRKVRGLTQQDLANKSGLYTRTIQKHEAGDGDTRTSTIKLLAKALDVPACYMLNSNLCSNLDNCSIHCPVEVLDMMHVGVQVNNLEGLICYVNKTHAETIGHLPEEIVNKLYIWDVLADKSDAPKLKEYLRKLIIEQPTPSPYFAKNKNAEGNTIPVKVDWNYLRDKTTNKVIGFISIITTSQTPII
ncbi:MAG: helix-turn-helix domain-containing protein [Bacteriovoracaceae bacterium]